MRPHFDRHLIGSLPGIALLLVAGLAVPAAADTPKPATGIHYVYLVRHGIYDRDDAADDVTGNGLNALGHVQARRIGERLAALPVRPASLVSSAYRRARETADDMGGVMKMTPSRDSLISECTPTSEIADYTRGDSKEETERCERNLAAAWARYLTPSPAADRLDVLVCHGNVIRWFVSRALGGEQRWNRMEIGNGSLTILAVRPDGTVRVVTFSDVGHIPVAEQTWTGKGAGWSAPTAR